MDLALSHQVSDDLANELDFKARVRSAIVRKALAIFPDAKPARSALALAVLNGASGYVDRFTIAIATTVNSRPVNDATLDTTVETVWNDIAGETT